MSRHKYSRFVSVWRRNGGFRQLRGYAKLGIAAQVIREAVKGIFKRKSFEEIYGEIRPLVIRALRRRYGPFMAKRLEENERDAQAQSKSNRVWVCWLQGIETAPPIVKACLESLKRNLKDREITVIDEQNRKEFIQFPAFIEQRWEQKQIPAAAFTDLLRLELLIRYGGTWVDATVLCTMPDYPQAFLDADLFFYQYRRPDFPRYAGISNWMITACSHHPLLMTLRDALYAYWEDFDCILEYFIFHRFFDVLARLRPEVVARMPYASSLEAHMLGGRLKERFSPRGWESLTTRIPFHKLTYKKLEKGAPEAPPSYYDHILRIYGQLS